VRTQGKGKKRKNLTLMKKLRDPAVVIVKTYHCKDGKIYVSHRGWWWG
jgi:hypothetical protein